MPIDRLRQHYSIRRLWPLCKISAACACRREKVRDYGIDVGLGYLACIRAGIKVHKVPLNGQGALMSKPEKSFPGDLLTR